MSVGDAVIVLFPMNFRCLFKHRMKMVHEGRIEYAEKKNHKPLSYRGIWQVYECKYCGYQKAVQIREEKIGPYRDAGFS